MKHALSLLAGERWAITPEYLGLMLAIAGRQPLAAGLEAVSARLGRPLDNTRLATFRDGVAIVPVTGPVFRYANVFSAVSGATSVNLLARDFSAAVENPNVRAVLLDIDSPGGQVNGVSEFADMVFAARQAGKKIGAYVSDKGLSAAYWIASAASEIVVAETAQLGSIGVVLGILDTRERDRKEGIEEIEIVSSNAPGKRVDPATDEGRRRLQEQVDAVAAVFTGKVARNRGVSIDTVNNEFGRGGILVGRDAVAAGLGDRLGSFEGLLAQLAGNGAVAGGRILSNERSSIMHTTDRAPVATSGLAAGGPAAGGPAIGDETLRRRAAFERAMAAGRVGAISDRGISDWGVSDTTVGRVPSFETDPEAARQAAARRVAYERAVAAGRVRIFGAGRV